MLDDFFYRFGWVGLVLALSAGLNLYLNRFDIANIRSRQVRTALVSVQLSFVVAFACIFLEWVTLPVTRPHLAELIRGRSQVVHRVHRS
jgi:hypothetical protein